MGQFSTVFSFELMAYIKNKSFVITSAALIGIALLVGFIPMIVAGVGGVVGGIGAGAETPPIGIYDARSLFSSQLNSTGPISDQMIDAHLGEGTWVWLDAADVGRTHDAVAEGRYSAVLEIGMDGLTYTLTMVGADAMTFNHTRIDRLIVQGSVASRLAGAGLMSEAEAAELLGVSTNPIHVFVGRDGAQSFLIGYALLMVLYMSIILYGSQIIMSVATEKSTKVMELLIISVKPAYMIFGKVLSAALAGLLQLVAIIAAAIVGINVSIAAGVEIPAFMAAIVEDLANTGSIAVYAVIFFLLGFLTFSFLFAAFGAMASSIEDVKSLSGYPIYLFLPGFFIAIFAMTNPTAGHVAPLSFVPFISPLIMFARISMTEVPVSQIVISIAINAATIVAAGIFSAKLYRAGVLMYGVKPSVKNMWKYFRQA